ncbi:DUF1493 family protein [Flavobacterium rhamnosiphilum]|nr:DUF1493 family protein [Flavobacterium rhamnosiphilum]
MKTIIKIRFKDLKQNYLEVQQFLEEKSGEKKICNKSKVANDLSLWGDDNYDMLEDFITKYNLDFSGFNYGEHFESEGEMFGPLNFLFGFVFTILYILKYVLFLTVALFSKKHSKEINDFKFHIEENKIEKKDLTMGDLIASKVQGKFNLRENVKFVFN